MSGEIKVNASLEVANGNFKLPKLGSIIQAIDQTTPAGGYPGLVIAVPAATAAQGTVVPATGLVSLGWTYICNLDLTNYVEYGPLVAGTLHPFGKLKPGESAVFRIKPGTAWNIRALVADCRCQVIQIED